MEIKVIKGKELKKMIDNQEICIRCGASRKEIRAEGLNCYAYGELYNNHIYK